MVVSVHVMVVAMAKPPSLIRGQAVGGRMRPLLIWITPSMSRLQVNLQQCMDIAVFFLYVPCACDIKVQII